MFVDDLTPSISVGPKGLVAYNFAARSPNVTYEFWKMLIITTIASPPAIFVEPKEKSTHASLTIDWRRIDCGVETWLHICQGPRRSDWAMMTCMRPQHRVPFPLLVTDLFCRANTVPSSERMRQDGFGRGGQRATNTE